jgi:hypothetical protein
MSGLDCNSPEPILITFNMRMLPTFLRGKLELDLVADCLSKILELMWEQLGFPHGMNIVPASGDVEYYIAVPLK